jgi:lycopene cyclase domain-containing protein
MDSAFTYLVIDACAVAVPLIASFHPSVPFYREWKHFLPACVIASILFIAWDAAFTEMGIWSFSPQHTLSARFLGLPIEEVLFFICIPYACVFTYYCIGRFVKITEHPAARRFTGALAIFAAVTAALNFHLGYTFAATSGLFLTLMVVLMTGARYLSHFLIAYAVLLLPFTIVNGLLTGSFGNAPVVLYNDAGNTGARFLNIPGEDFAYCMMLLLVNVALYERFRNKKTPGMSRGSFHKED